METKPNPIESSGFKTLIATTIAAVWIMLPNIIGIFGSAVIVYTDR